jgi:hypothetical protein
MKTENTSEATNKIGEYVYKFFGREKPILPESLYSKIGVPKRTFRRYVNNELQPRLDELVRIAEWLNVNPKDLF